MMQRRLVLTNESAGHPIRRMLPPPPPHGARARPLPWFRREDGQLFMLSFAAFFTAFYGFIA
jgi:hypothetical protein